MNTSDNDEAIGYVNKIIENIRCAVCGRLEGSRLRYPCGHTACDECVSCDIYCQTCSRTSGTYDSEPKPDHPLTQAVKHAAELLTASKTLFDASAFKYKRLSERLRIEKELFPQCIQAPVKYENKRKSIRASLSNKENKCATYFPGEAIASLQDRKMDNSMNYVQQWLNKNENSLARRPFSDLNVNTQRVNNINNHKTKENNTENKNVTKAIKRSYSNTKKVNSNNYNGSKKKAGSTYESNPKKIKIETQESIVTSKSSDIQKKCDKDESGVFMDNDPIVIDDSQDLVIDKDKKAWLAVLKASEKEQLTTSIESTSEIHSNLVNITNDSNKITNKTTIKQINETSNTKVPFYKKSAMIEICSLCRNDINTVKSMPQSNETNPVKITIDNDHFLTTITVFKNVTNNTGTNATKCGVSVQTDSCKNNCEEVQSGDKDIKDCVVNNQQNGDLIDNESAIENDIQSQDLFADDKRIYETICSKQEITKCVVIEESDSDLDIDLSGPVSVVVDVHRSKDEFENGTLEEIVDIKEHESKLRRGPRGHTPTSTDSSEKENFNPNRIRKSFKGKKKGVKK